MAKRKKKKNGHVAIPFLLAFLLGIVCIGGVAAFIFSKISDKEELRPMASSIVKPTEADNMTLLFVLDEPDGTCPVTLLVARVLPAEKKMMLVSLPSNMLAAVDGKQQSLAQFYRSGGISMLKQAIESESGIVADRYIILGSEGFQKICNIFAGVYYPVPTGFKGFTDSSEPQYLGPGQIEKLLTYPAYEKGESERSTLTADLLCDMVNQTDYERIAASMDSNFKVLVNMMDTDITSIDYGDHKEALKYMYKYGNKICTFRIAVGTDTEDGYFILGSSFRDTVADYFTDTPDTADGTGEQ